MDDPFARIWKALADPTRRSILDLLKDRPRTTSELCSHFAVSRFGVMKHLDVLAEADLIVIERRGRERLNHLNVLPLQRIYERWLSGYQRVWAGRLLTAFERFEKGEATTMPEVKPSDIRAVHIAAQAEIHASPEAVFRAITADFGRWWGAPYLLEEQRASELVLEARPGGLLYEKWGADQGGVWGHVAAIRPPERLELCGPMGMRRTINGWVSFELEPSGSGTLLKLFHHAVGDIPEAVEQNYDRGWQDLLGRLKEFVETGVERGLAASKRS